ncbi:MAG: ribokinase [Gemmataceae bacterium]
MKPILVVGSLNIDFVINTPRHPAAGQTLSGSRFDVFPGGKGANQAYGAAKLGGQVAMLGQLGNDAHAGWLRQHLKEGGVDTAVIQNDDTVSSGVAFIIIEADSGQNRIIIVPGANGTFSSARLEASEKLFAGAGFVLLQLEVPLETTVRAAKLGKQHGACVILDPAPAQPIGRDLLELVDYVTPNETELEALTGGDTSPPAEPHAELVRRAEMLRDLGARKVIVKRGGQGATLVSEAGSCSWPALPVNAVDTTAAGDCFNAAFAVALAEGKSEDEAGLFATTAASISVTRAGAQPSMPNRIEVDRALAERGR